MPAHREISSAEYEVLAEFRYCIRRFLHFSEQAARRAGLEPQQHQLLLALRGCPRGTDATIGRLAERLQIQHHSAVELADRLERRGWISRRHGDADRREVLVRLTPQGTRALGELTLAHREELRSAAPDLARALNAVVRAFPAPARSARAHSEPREAAAWR